MGQVPGLVLMTMTTPHLHNTASPTSGRKPAAGGGWLAAVRRYLAVIAVGNLLWEFAQLPLYTIWYEGRSEEHTSELQSLMRISYAVFCLKKKTKSHPNIPASALSEA